MIVGCYTLDLYCDHERCSPANRRNEPGVFCGKNRSAATKEARAHGWSVTHASPRKPGRAICPDCSQRGAK